jgi:aspartate/methionine/tyrosine aminotransferase
MPQGTFYAFVNISGLGLKSIKASSEILEKAKVAVVPGIAYGKNFDDYIRISLATSDENLRKALQNLSVVYGEME